MSDRTLPASLRDSDRSPVARRARASRASLACVAGVLLALLAGCQSTPDTKEQSGATVESRELGKQPPVVVPQPPSKDPLAQKPVGQPPIAEQPIKAEPAAPGALPGVLRDPKSLLSRRSVYFDYDSNQVKDEYRPMIQAHARFLLDNPRLRVTIQGNTDERGSREYNLALGQRRADAVRQAMAVLGVSEKQMEPVSLGEERPRAPGSDEAAYAENRRADIVYDGEDKPPIGK